MFSDRPFTRFSNNAEYIDYLVKYGFISSASSKVPILYFPYENTMRKCEIIGYEEQYDDWSVAVIDFGNGAYFIHSDYLKDLQSPDRNKGNRLDKLPNRFVLFDLETTDLNIYECEIIQISAIRVENLEIVDTFDTFVKPEKNIPAHITKLTGITDLDVAFAPEEDVALQQFLEFVGNDIVAGQNIQRYDTNIVYDHCKRLFDVEFSNDYVDFLYMYKEILTEKGIKLKNYKKDTVATYLGVSTEGSHNGLTDCKICLEICRKLLGVDEVEIDNSMLENSSDTEDGKEIGRNIADNPVEQAIIDMINRLIKEYKLPEDGLYLSVNERKPDPKTGKLKKPTKTIAIHEPAYPPMAYDTQGFNVRVTTIEPVSFKTKEDMLYFHFRPAKYERLPYEGTNEVAERKSTDKKTGEESIVEYIVKNSLNDVSILDWIEQHTRKAIENYVSSASFGCCSKQSECIKAGECLHVNRLYACGCMQRRNLPKKW